MRIGIRLICTRFVDALAGTCLPLCKIGDGSKLVGKFNVGFVEENESVGVIRESNAVDQHKNQMSVGLRHYFSKHGSHHSAWSCHEDEQESDKDYRSVHRVLSLSWGVVGDCVNTSVFEQEDEHGVHDEQESEGHVGVETGMNLGCWIEIPQQMRPTNS